MLETTTLYIGLTVPPPDCVMLTNFGLPSALGTPTLGMQSAVKISGASKFGSHLLVIELWPFFRQTLPHQCLEVVANGRPIAQVRVEDWSYLGFEIPAGLVGVDGVLYLQFRHPTARSPAELDPSSTDERLLSVNIVSLFLQPLLTDTARRLAPARDEGGLQCFESLGDDCEFGLVQRRNDIEQISLFRFAGVPLRYLIRAFYNNFEGMEELTPDDLHLDGEGPGAEYLVIGGRYSLRYHSNVRSREVGPAAAMTQDALLKKLRTKLMFERRKFNEDIEEGNRIWVFRGNTVDQVELVLPLFYALTARGPNTLLWVRVAESASQIGTVEELRPGLLCGHIDRFATVGAPADASDDVWLRICDAALQVVAERSA